MRHASIAKVAKVALPVRGSGTHDPTSPWENTRPDPTRPGSGSHPRHVGRGNPGYAPHCLHAGPCFRCRRVVCLQPSLDTYLLWFYLFYLQAVIAYRTLVTIPMPSQSVISKIPGSIIGALISISDFHYPTPSDHRQSDSHRGRHCPEPSTREPPLTAQREQRWSCGGKVVQTSSRTPLGLS